MALTLLEQRKNPEKVSKRQTLSKSADELAQKGKKWRVNPPSAPHQGGILERLVRSFKRVLYNILGKRRFTDEVLHTTFCHVEQALNLRALTPVSADACNLNALTPNNFLLGEYSTGIPFPLLSPIASRALPFYEHGWHSSTRSHQFSQDLLPGRRMLRSNGILAKQKRVFKYLFKCVKNLFQINKTRSNIRRRPRKISFNLFLSKYNHDMGQLMWFLD